MVEAGDHHVIAARRRQASSASTASPRASRCTAGRSSRPTGATCSSPRATAGSSKFDLWNLKTVAEVRAGINTRNVAVSRRRQVCRGRQLPAAHAGAARRRPQPAQGASRRARPGRQDSSRVSAVYDAAPRRSFVAALKDIPEIWEISYDPKAEPIYEGCVHDYKMGEGARQAGLPQPAPHRRSTTSLDDFFFDQSYAERDRRRRAEARQGPGGQPRRARARSPTCRSARHAAPRLGHHLGIPGHAR
ncbi:MAG: hypothetical protein MZW92_43005 [Comamonadaceae bacterium]|nr:hypothetical protein [Comamonadaceae bacterium]